MQEELKRQTAVRKLVDSQPYIMKLNSIMTSQRNGLRYHFVPDSNSLERYQVTVLGWGDWEGETRIVSYYRLAVNTRQESVEIKSQEKELYHYR